MTARARFEWTRQPGVGPPLDVLGGFDGRVVVELGCGAGHNLAYLVAHHSVTGIGVDHNPQQINRANTLYGHVPGLTFVEGDASTQLATMDAASVDICLSIFGAFTFASPRPLLASAARALKPGGRLAIALRADDHHDTVAVLQACSSVEQPSQ